MECENLKSRLLHGMFQESFDEILNPNVEELKAVFSSLEEVETKKLDKMKFTLAKVKIHLQNNKPRYIDLQHPYAYLKLVYEVCKSWNEIKKSNNGILKSNKNLFSYTDSNVQQKYKRLYFYKNKYSGDKIDEQNKKIETISFAKQYKVYADISNFYKSIYTHSIPWALGGKEEAKKNRSEDEFFNKIDKHFRNMNDTETLGIPIGCDVSSLFAEFILNKIDATESMNKYSYVRFVDDYTCYTASKEEAENFIIDLEHALKAYNLTLNSSKLKIEEINSINLNHIQNIDNFEDILNQTFSFDKILHEYGDIVDVHSIESKLYSILIENKLGEWSRNYFEEREVPEEEYKKLINLLNNFHSNSNLKTYFYQYFVSLLFSCYKNKLIKFEYLSELKKKLNTSRKFGVQKSKEDLIMWSLFLMHKLDDKKEIDTKEFQKIYELNDDMVNSLLYEFGTSEQQKNLKEFVNKDGGWLAKYQLALHTDEIIKKDVFLEKCRLKKINFLKTEKFSSGNFSK